MTKKIIVGGFCKEGLEYIESLVDLQNITVIDNLQEIESFQNFSDMEYIPFHFHLISIESIYDCAYIFDSSDEIRIFIDRYTKYEESPSRWLTEFVQLLESISYNIIMSNNDRDKLKVFLHGTYSEDLENLIKALLEFYQEKYDIYFQLVAKFL